MAVGANAGLAGLNVNVGVNLQQFDAGMRQVEQRGAQAAASLNNVGSALTTGAGIGAGFAVASAALSAISSTAAAAASAVVGLNSDLEQARIGFTAFTGSAEKANAFVKQLQDFAAKTTFEFPGLLQAARQLTGMGVQAELVIPILKDVGTAVMSVGGNDVAIKRVNLALTQMMAAGKVNAQDMNQLAQAGLPAWQMLADSMGMTIGQVRELSKQGKITADQMLQAFHDFATKNGMSDMLAKSSQTWAAASSNIIDGLRNIGAEGFEPLFNVMRDFAVKLADILTGDGAKQFAADLKATVQDIISTAAPLGDAFNRAFEAFKTDGVTGALNSILTDVKALATEMGGAGVTLISEFAGGIIQGASTLITDAANFVADIIASYLIGNSPPPVGPLSQIAQGGTNVIAAYVDGLKQGTSGVADVAQSIVDAFGNVDGAMTLSQGRAALQAAGTDMKALGDASSEVEGVIRGLDTSIRDNQASLRDYQNAATDIKDAFEAAIDPLQRQVDALKEANDLTTKQADLQDKMALVQLKGALQTAQGDPVKRAQLQTQLDTLEQQEKELTLQESAVRLQGQSAALAAKARGEKVTNTTQSQAENALAQRRLTIQQQQNTIQQQLNGMVDKEAVARIKTQQAQVTAVKDQRDITTEVEQLNRQLQAAPLEQQIKDLKEQQTALLAPINERITATQREGQALSDQKKGYQDIKSAISDVMQEQRAAAASAKADAAAASKDAKTAALAHVTDLSTIFKPEEITAGAAKVGHSFVAGFGAYLQANMASIIGVAVGGVLGGAAFGPLGAVAGAAFGKSFMERMQANFGSMENIGGLIAGKISDALNIDTGKATNAAEAFAIIWEKTKERIHLAVEQAIIEIGHLLDIDVSSGATQADRLAIIWEEVSTRTVTAITNIQTTIQPTIDGIAHQWQTMVDAVNSAEFHDNISLIASNINEIVTHLNTTLADLSTAIQTANTNQLDGTQYVTFGSVVMGVVSAVAQLTTALVNIYDLIVSTSSILVLFVQNVQSAFQGAADIIKATMAFVSGDFDAAEAIFGDKLKMDADIKARGADIQKTWADMLARMQARNDAAKNVGKSVTDGVAAGITAGQPAVETAATTLATGTVSKFAETMQSRSPSVVMTEQGTFVTDGLTAGITAGTVTVLAAVTDQCAQMLAAYTEGWSAISAGTQAQLDEIYALMQGKFTDMNGLVPIMMGTMLADFATGFSAIHTQTGTQLDEIHTLIMMQSEQWRAAGLALGTALGEGIAAAQLSVQRSMMQLMSAGGGVSGGSKADPQMQALLNQMASKYKLDPKLFTAQMQLESAGFDPNVTSGKRRGGSGEVGIGQFMEGNITARLKAQGMTLDQYLGDANVQVEQAAKYMAELVTTFGDYDKALQAYNGGAGGIGTSATQKYSDLVHQIATTLQAQTSTGGTLMSAGAGNMTLNTSQIKAATAGGLSAQEASTFCGPYAAMLFAQATGRNPTAAEARELASAVGWTAQDGMGGTGNFMNLLGRMGVDAVRQAATPQNVNAALGAGKPVAFSTRDHYFVGNGGTAEGGINVGATGTVMPGGASTMTLDQIAKVGGGMQDLIVLQGKLDQAGTQTFTNLTRVSGQFGTAVNGEVETLGTDVQTVGTQGATANAQLQASTQTLATSIQSGVVPAGLAARDAVGQMAIGIQPLIAAWANGQVTGDQLAASIVQLSADTGLATQPLAAYTAGNMSVGEALRNVMVSLAQADPAFAQIQTAMQGTQLSTQQLADVMLRGLANVTGNVSSSMAQAAQGVVPLQTAFASGAISGDQFVASVVELAATTGLTQAPLRLMQDGVITANEALGQVVEAAGSATPSLLGMSTAFGELPAPATDAANAFLDWIKSLADAATATTVTTDAIATVPDAVTDLAQPMQQASTDVMQTLPDATTEALNSAVDAVRNISSSMGDAAKEVGQAIVDGIKQTVEAAAEDIAKSAQDIVEKALDAAKKAADEVKKSVDKGSKGGGDDTDSKATGGRLQAGTWTLVGEQGPELISPTGYVYTAGETAGMIAGGISSGLFQLHKFASGGQLSKSKTKSKKKDKDTDTPTTPTTPTRVDAPKTGPELDLEQKILEVTQARNKVLAEIAPIEAMISQEEYEQKKATAGSFQDQMRMADNKKAMLQIDLQINKLTYQADANGRSLFDMQSEMTAIQKVQADAAKGDIKTQLMRNQLDVQRLTNESQIAAVQVMALPTRQKLADVEKQIADIEKGSLADQLQTQAIQAQQHVNQLKINQLQLQEAPLQAEALSTQAEINKILAGTAEQRKTIAANAQKTAALDVQSLQNQAALLPIQSAIRKTQETIDDLQRGTLEEQYQSIDAQKQSAALRLQEIGVQGKLRNVANGTLNLSQEEVNALQKQLESIEAQKSNLDDTTEVRQLNATIASTDAQKTLVGLQDAERAHTRIGESLDEQKSTLQNQNDTITAQNTLSATGQQAKLNDLNLQIAVYDAQVGALQAQNGVLDLQVENIKLGNQIRGDALGVQLIMLQNQVAQYDAVIGKLQTENDKIAVQTTLIDANNTLAAAGLNAQIIMLQTAIDKRQGEIDKLNTQKTLIQGQTDLITIQNGIVAAGHDAAIISLNAQKATQDDIVTALNIQLGSLNAQKQVYQDIRDLANQIASRPPGTGGPATTTGGPPGNVVATASKSGQPTLYLSRGTGTDGWYTSDGRLMVQGGSANPGSGYSVRWLAEGGVWHRGEVAVVGEDGPELAIAAQDMHVFPHERAASIARAFGKAGVAGAGGEAAAQKSVTVNVEYHTHSGSQYGEGTLQQVVREAVFTALRN